MLNEQEREDGPEEGEYHFSDEGGYESSMEEDEAKAPIITEAGGLAAKFSSYRRVVIVGAIFAVVLLLTYLVVTPLATAPSTDIVAAASPSVSPPERVVEASARLPAKPEVVVPVNTASPTNLASKNSVEENTAPPAKPFARFREKMAAEKEKMVAHFTATAKQEPAEPPSALVMPTLGSTPAQAPGDLQAQPSATDNMNSTAISAANAATYPAGGVLASMQEAQQNKALVERLAALEESNTKLIGQLHAEYSNKVSNMEFQDKALEEQVRTLTARLTSMEVEMNRLLQALNKQQQQPAPQPASAISSSSNDSVNDGNSNSLTLSNSPAAPAAVPMQANDKPNYSVQAIIPGRAWLRTENGETVTVAEGDTLKNLGRVTKIDPYDGTIQIDTGTKVLTLTYGNGDYA